jgi:hypothetical protein
MSRQRVKSIEPDAGNPLDVDGRPVSSGGSAANRHPSRPPSIFARSGQGPLFRWEALQPTSRSRSGAPRPGAPRTISASSSSAGPSTAEGLDRAGRHRQGNGIPADRPLGHVAGADDDAAIRQSDLEEAHRRRRSRREGILGARPAIQVHDRGRQARRGPARSHGAVAAPLRPARPPATTTTSSAKWDERLD